MSDQDQHCTGLREQKRRDDRRWRLVKCALHESKLSDTARLVAIGAIVNSRDPLSSQDIERTRELAERFGWE